MKDTPTPDTSQDELRTRAIADELESLWQIANKYKDGWLKMAELVQASYLPRKDVVEAIGKDEAFVDISEIDHTGKVTNIIKGNSYTPVMVGRNQLRAELRTKLGLDANGGGLMSTNNIPDPNVAAWMKSMGYELDSFGCWWRLHPSGNFYEYLSKGQAAFFYHAQQRAVLEGRIDGLNLAWQEIAGVTEGKPNRVMKCLQVIEAAKTELEAQLQNNKEGKL